MFDKRPPGPGVWGPAPPGPADLFHEGPGGPVMPGTHPRMIGPVWNPAAAQVALKVGGGGLMSEEPPCASKTIPSFHPGRSAVENPAAGGAALKLGAACPP